MNERRDLGVSLVGAALLMLSMVYLAQCSSRTPAPGPSSQPGAAAPSARGTGANRQDERGAAEKDNDEAARVKGVAHVIQTIGADPELRKTYGFE